MSNDNTTLELSSTEGSMQYEGSDQIVWVTPSGRKLLLCWLPADFRGGNDYAVHDDTIAIFSLATGLPVIINFTGTLAELRRLGVIEMGNSLAGASDESLVVHAQTL
jgi:hypothetical protein